MKLKNGKLLYIFKHHRTLQKMERLSCWKLGTRKKKIDGFQFLPSIIKNFKILKKLHALLDNVFKTFKVSSPSLVILETLMFLIIH